MDNTGVSRKSHLNLSNHANKSPCDQRSSSIQRTTSNTHAYATVHLEVYAFDSSFNTESIKPNQLKNDSGLFLPQNTAITVRFILALFYSPHHTFLRLDLEAYDICRFLTFLRCVIALP